MAIQTDLSGAPYYDDYDENKNYYKILFRPGVAIQARELNQLQTILQNQIERFGDHVFKQGTIIDGCNITYHSYFPYVKIRDIQSDGISSINVSDLQGYRIRHESSNLQAVIIQTAPGFESREDKKTLYVRYQNSGTSGNTSAFSANQVLTVYDVNTPIESIRILNGSAGFSNNDTVVFVPAIAVQNTTGGNTFANVFSVDDQIYTASANLIITDIDTTTNSEVVILKVKPVSADLANTELTAIKWTVASNDTFVSAANNQVNGTIVTVFGSNAEATLATTAGAGGGTITSINISEKGLDYNIAPHVTVQTSTGGVAEIDTLQLEPQTYKARLTVLGALDNPVGSGYAVSVGEGIVYQKGYFTKVLPQTVIVDRYSALPDQVVVGFDTKEEIINSNQDTSLLDNSLGTPNATAPGANRLKLSPTLVTLTKEEAEANTRFLPIIEFSEGYPAKRFTQTQYNGIAEEFARRTYEESGNYVLDQFLTTTKSRTTFAEEANSFSVVVDPGLAYIEGKRVQTYYNYSVKTDKAINTATTTVSKQINYGNFIRVKELGGKFNFTTGDVISLRSEFAQFLTNGGGNITAAGSEVGTARVRSVLHERGVAGTPEAVYRVYLFDIVMNAGENFADIRSIYQDNDYDGIADVVVDTIVVETPIQILANTGANTTIVLVSGNTTDPVTDTTEPSRGIGTPFFMPLFKEQYEDRDNDFDVDQNFKYRSGIQRPRWGRKRRIRIGDKLTRSGDLAKVNTDIVCEVTSIINATAFTVNTAVATGNGTATVSFVNTYITTASLYDSENSTLIFSIDKPALKSVNATSYTSRQTSEVTLDVNGNTTITLTGNNTYSSINARLIDLIPVANLTSNVISTGNTTTTTTSNVVTGSDTVFHTTFYAGDNIKIVGGANTVYGRITNVINATAIQLATTPSSVVTSGNVYLHFPKNVPVDLLRTDRIANATSNTNLVLGLGTSLAASGNAVASYNYVITNADAPVTKNSLRSIYVRLKLANNEAAQSAIASLGFGGEYDYGRGPWALGFSDVFRLRGVYAANGAANTTITFNSNSDVSANVFTVESLPFANGDSVVYTVPSVVTNTSISVTANSAAPTVFVIGSNTGINVNDLVVGSSNTQVVNTNISAKVATVNSTHFTTNTAIGLTNATATVTVSNTVAGTPITGLTGGNTYYIANTTSTTFKIANSSGGVISVAAISSSQEHQFVGAPLYFGPDTYGVYDVTDQFYVDSNQTEDSYNTSYLYRNANITSNTYSNNDVLLIKIDVFTRTGEGLKTIKSYQVNDAVSFANATNTYINTAEIPELYGNRKGEYYDLRDSLDFRPFANNTASANGNFRYAPINPTEPTGTSKYNTSNKNFPVPGSAISATIEYYLPRIDRVVVDSDNKIRVLSGDTSPNGPSVPPQPAHSMTLNLLNIPPYPSYPYALSEDTIKYIDTNMGNEKLLAQRLKKYQVTQNVTVDQRQALQPRAYKMTDIGQLERRIRDLEYYVSFTLAETAVNSRYIASSSSAALNRYKFGFYVDNFNDDKLSDLDNPEYSCSIYDNKLVPKVEQLIIPVQPKDPEDGGTEEPVIEPEPCTEANAIPTDTTLILQRTQIFVGYATTDYGTVATDLSKFRTQGPIEFSSSAGQAKVYVDVPYASYRVEVYQGTSRTFVPGVDVLTPLITSESAVALTNQEKRQRSLRLVKYQTFSSTTVSGVNVVRGSSVITWNHNPSGGRFYKIVVYRVEDRPLPAGRAERFVPEALTFVDEGKIVVLYPEDYFSKKLERTIVIDKIIHRGAVNRKSPIRILRPFRDTRRISRIPTKPWVEADQAIRIELCGLKPNTKHEFILDGYKISQFVRQVGKDITEDLVADKYGKIVATVYLNELKTTSQTQLSETLRDQRSTNRGDRMLVVVSEDQTSSAVTTISQPSFTTDYVNSTNESEAVVQPTTTPSVVPVTSVATADSTSTDNLDGSSASGADIGTRLMFATKGTETEQVDKV